MAAQEEPDTKQFHKIIKDFMKDILTTFPEFKDKLHQGLIDITLDNPDTSDSKEVYEHCKSTFPSRFFDILYEREEMFDTQELMLLPGIDFVQIWKSEITDKTKQTIWKYLQLLLFSVVKGLDSMNDESFGDTAKLFEAINQDEFKSKLEATVEEMQNIFDLSGSDVDGMDISGIKHEDLPDVESIHNHITEMLDGKIGSLAKEIAEETSRDLNIDMDDATSMNDVFEKLFKNPTKLMGLVKSVGTKLDTKLKSGEIKESELIEEAQEMVEKMQSIPGMGNMQSLFDKMGMGGMAGMGGKMNMGAMRSQMNTNLRNAKMKERMQEKLKQRQAQRMQQQSNNTTPSVFSTGEVVEKSMRGDQERVNNKKKKNRKKKKNNKKNK